jgi:hypothetical protein
MALCIGSLIKPKQMLASNSDKSEIMNIYFYLYKFSLQRLNQLLNSKPLTLLLAFYCQEGHDCMSANMKRHELAYYEAMQIIMLNNCLSPVLATEFNLSKVLHYQFKVELNGKSIAIEDPLTRVDI